MIVLIPAYEPDHKLIQLIKDLSLVPNCHMIVVDDGSGPAYRPIFQMAKSLDVKVLTHQTNHGKGVALKTGFNYILKKEMNEEIVCADSDGQHTPKDIIKIAKAISMNEGHIILGSREFSNKTPIKSRFGNILTRTIFHISTGIRLTDTQTGLRGFSASMLPWLIAIKGERFDYEMNMLLSAKKNGWQLLEIPIHTIYFNENESTHFRAIVDSFLVYLPLLKFGLSSITAGVIDFVALLALNQLTNNLLISVIGARAISSLINYTINCHMVFGTGSGLEKKKTLTHYYTLVVALLISNYLLIHILHINLGLNLVTAKLITEGLLFFISYWAQKKVIFKNHLHTSTYKSDTLIIPPKPSIASSSHKLPQ